MDKEPIEKRALISELVAFLRDEYDALSDSDRKQELRRSLLMLRHLPARHYECTDPIIPSSLVKVRLGEVFSWVLIVPSGGGWVLRYAGVPVQVLSPESPLGAALLGRKTGDEIQLSSASGSRSYAIELSI